MSIINGKKQADPLSLNEKTDDLVLRPQNLKEYVGQSNIKKSLSVSMQASKERGECLEHILLFGPPGLGKTSLAMVIANEMEAHIVKTTATSFKRVIDLFSMIMTLQEHDVLFIDEIHRLDKRVEESLYSVMEDFQIHMVRGSGRNIKAVNIPCRSFTLIGATTRSGLLSKPLRDRFGLSFSFSFYTKKELVTVIQHAADHLHFSINHAEAEEIAQRSRGTPRIAIHLVKRARDVATVHQKQLIDQEVVQETFRLMQLDDFGLSDHDRRLLLLLYQKQGKPMGLNTLCAILNEDKTTFEEVVEPYLLSLGFLEKTPRGRLLTPEGYKYMSKHMKMIDREVLF